MGTPLSMPKGKPSAIFDPTPTSQLLCHVFKRVQCVIQPQGGNLIAWELFDKFSEAGPYHFFVDFGRSGVDFGNEADAKTEWETLNVSPIVDQCLFYDPKQHYYDHLADYFYRVRLVLPSVIDPATGKEKVYFAQPQQANGFLAKRDWLVARDICRKEYLLQRKRTNISNRHYLLKRKRWGNPCPDCKEFDTGEVINGRCPKCWGTGFIGGFYPALEFTATISNAPYSREFVRDEQVSLRNSIIRWGRAVAYPYVDTNDLLVRKDNGERYYVNRVQTGAEISGMPLIIIMELRLAPITDIAYTIPLQGAPFSSSSSQSTSSDSEAQDGLTHGVDNWGNGHM